MIEAGRPQRLGAEADAGGVNFAVYSGCADRVDLCLFDAQGRERERHPLPGNDAGTWHGYLPGCRPGQVYGYRVHGPWDPAAGLRCNPHKVLLDPFARRLAGGLHWGPAVYDFVPGSMEGHWRMSRLDSAGAVPLGVVTGDPGVRPRHPGIAWTDTVLYEANLRGMTMRHPDVPEADRGRLAGMRCGAVLQYLKALGITAVELQPLQAFTDESFLAARGMRNYWGYNTLAFFAVAPRYAHGDPLAEVAGMVDAIHEAGLEVILDVAFNHTAEGGARGPSLSMRGLDNLAYYRTVAGEPGRYINDTGCGNTLNTAHPQVQHLVIESLAWWHSGLGFDGFRFDLAAALFRGADGFDRQHPLLQALLTDPRLAGAKLIAEPWDVGPGGYQLGAFGAPWSEWNDQYRDCMRRFWRGDAGQTGAFARRVHGSADLFEPSGRGPTASINFITAHDGFTLADLVSYDNRHNQANGEDNRDGHAHNFSSNHGVEGPTGDRAINALRRRQRLNLMASLLFSQGTPMLLAGDEFGHSQHGNNNAYCQDNPTAWLDWSRRDEDPEFTAQVRRLLALRSETPLLRYDGWLHGHAGPCIDWLGTDGKQMRPERWEQANCFALHLCGPVHPGQPERGLEAVLILVNRTASARRFDLPRCPAGTGWRVAFYSGAPADPGLEGLRCSLVDRSIACLLPTA